MSIKKRCPKGHYYDSKFAYCPYCEDSKNTFSGERKNRTGPFSGILKKSFSFQKKSSQEKDEDIHEIKTAYAKDVLAQDDIKTEYMKNDNTDDLKTEYLSNKQASDDVKTEYLGKQQINNKEVDLDDMKTEYLTSQKGSDQQIVNSHGDMTSQLATKVPSNAVVGWLVCTNGTMTGKSLIMCRGVNSILKKGSEYTVSNEIVTDCYFELIYDEKGRKYYITVNADNIGLNNRKIKGKRSLYDGSIIQTEKSLFEFVAYCKGINKWQR